MVRFAAFALFVPALCAQLNSDVLEKAPPDVEDALRARMTQFFQLHVEGKYRQAEKLVAEETMDYYYNASKPKYLKFTIGKIKYSDNFTKAFSTVLCSMNVPFPGLAGKPLDVPTPSWWKLENGQWFWYIPQEKLLQTPFGTRKPESGEPAPAGGAGALPAKIPTDVREVQGLLNGVRADKTAVRLNSEKASSDQLVIENRLAGVVKLVLNAPKVAGLEARLERQELKPGEKTTLTFSYKPGGKAPERVTATVAVEPTNQAIPVDVRFGKLQSGDAAPAEGGGGLPAKIPDEREIGKLPPTVHADKTAVRLDPHEASSDQVVIENRLPGVVKLVVNLPKLAGLEARLDHEELKPGEKAALTFSYKPGGKAPARVAATVTVEPTNQAIPLDVLFAK